MIFKAYIFMFTDVIFVSFLNDGQKELWTYLNCSVCLWYCFNCKCFVFDVLTFKDQ